jgi:ParB/RepB/Spo0J family partition protein
METIEHIDPVKLVPSPHNYRKHLGDLSELTASMVQVGLLEPILTRMVGRKHEIVAGHRRAQAATAAGLPTVPVIVREYSDDQVLEVMLVENGQRADAHPLDEADAFAALVERGRTVTQIAEKIGRSGAYVAQRLALCQLGKEARKALDDDLISVGVAQLIARVPAKLQKDAVENATEHGHAEGHMSVKAARESIVRHYTLRLVDAPFERGDVELVPKAGACTTCPKRTGNQVELFADVDSPDLCTDPICYRSKLDAHWKLVVSDAKKGKGKAVLTVEESKLLFDSFNHTPKYGAPWVATDGEVSDAQYKRHKVKKLLKGADVETVLARNPHTGTIHELVSKKHVDRALNAAKKKETPFDKGREAEREAIKAAAAKDKLAQQVSDRADALLVDELVMRVEGRRDQDVRARVLTLVVAHLSDRGSLMSQAKRRDCAPVGSTTSDSVAAALVKWATHDDRDESEVLGLLVDLVCGGRTQYLSETVIAARDSLARLLDVNRKAIAKQAAKDVAAEAKKPKPAKGKKGKPAAIESDGGDVLGDDLDDDEEE